MAVFFGARVVRVLCVLVVVSCCCTTVGCARVAAECARWRLTFLGRDSTKRFLLLMMPKRRVYDKSMIEYNSDLNRM